MGNLEGKANEATVTVLDLNDPKVIRRIETYVEQVRRELRPLTDPLRRSAILTARDYNVIVY